MALPKKKLNKRNQLFDTKKYITEKCVGMNVLIFHENTILEEER